MAAAARGEQRWVAPGRATIVREDVLDLPLARGLASLEREHDCVVDVVCSDRRAGEVEAREGLAARAGERRVTALAGAVTGELSGDKRIVGRHQPRLAEGQPMVGRNDKSRTVRPVLAKGAAGRGSPGDIDLAGWAEGKVGALV